MKISVMIPAYNEAERIETTIRGVQTVPGVEEILVVDDGSTDNTSSKALRLGVRVICHQSNFGKGQALRTGFQSIRGDIIVLLDADIGEQAAEILKLIEPLQKDIADMTVAMLPPVEGTAKGLGLVKGLARWGIKRLTAYTPAAPLSGQRAIRKELLPHLHLSDGYGVEVAMTIDALHAGYRVLEVPVQMRNREYGRTLKGFLHRGRQFLHVGRALLERWNFNPADMREGLDLNK